MSDLAKKRYATLVVAQVATAVLAVFMNDFAFFVAGIVLCVALYSSTLIINWSLLSFIAPAASVVAVYAISDSSFMAFCFALYLPLGIISAFCVRKCYKRAKMVLFLSVGFGVAAISCLVVYFFITYDEISLSAFRNAIISRVGAIKREFLSQTEYALVLQADAQKLDINISSYISALSNLINYISFGLAAFIFNSASYLSTVFTKFTLKGFGGEKITTPFESDSWQFVLSKPSAVAFIAAYLCLAIGAETLTYAQTVAFYAIVIALSGGVLLMAVNRIKHSVKNSRSFFLPLLLAVLMFFFGTFMLILTLFVIGLFATFTFKNKEKADAEN